jgi:alkylation response protein AidB-like acyl-CoA dehydrogenase
MLQWNPFLQGDDIDFSRTVFSFAKEKILPSTEYRDEKEIWDDEIWKEISKAGLAGLPIPVEYGGQGASCFQSCLATESFSSGCLDGGLGLSWSAHMIIGAMPIVLQGNSFQKEKYLPKLASGEWISGLALTEASSGSDAGSLITRAEEVEGGFKLNGSKMYITNGSVGQLFIVMARTGGKSRGPMGISAFLVESNFPGFHVSKVLRKMGQHTSMTAELVFEDMFVPKENLLGPLGSGFLRIGKATLEWERTVLIAGVVGGMEFALSACLRYSHERKQFDKPISEFYAMQEKMVKIWINMNSARLLIYRAAREKDLGKSLPLLSSVCKLYTSEVGEDSAKDTIQIFGGYGFMREYQVERFYRDIKLATIGGGTSEIQRSIIFSMFSTEKNFMENFLALNSNSTLLENQENQFCHLIYKAIQELNDKSKIIKHQSFEFAIADLLTFALVLDTFLLELNKETLWYSTSDKQRDFKILLRFQFARFFLSLQTLSPSSVFLEEAIQLLVKSPIETIWIESCFKMLEGRL